MTKFLIELIEGDFFDRFEITTKYNYHNKIVFIVFDDRLFCRCIDEYRFTDGSIVKELIQKRYKLFRENHYYTVIIQIYRVDTAKLKKAVIYDSLIIGKHAKAVIRSDFMANEELFLVKDGRIIANFSDIYVNNVRSNQALLNDYDEITFRMIKIIYHRNFFLVSGFGLTIDKPLKIKRPCRQIREKAAVVKRNEDVICPSMQYEIKLDDYQEIENQSFLPGIIQSSIMTAGMCLMAGINLYSGFLAQRPLLELLPVAVMPLVMLLSTISMPVVNVMINRINRKKNLNNYEKRARLVIDRLENQIKSDWKSLIACLKQRSDNELTIIKAVDDRQLYFLRRDDQFFSGFNFGDGSIKSNLFIKQQFMETTPLIQNMIREIINQYQNVPSVPLWIRLSDYRLIHLIVPVDKTVSILKEWILKIAYRHDYRDLKIALEPESVLVQDQTVMEIKHLFYQSRRLLISKLDELNKIDGCHIIYFTQSSVVKSSVAGNITCVFIGDTKGEKCDEDLLIDYCALSYDDFHNKTNGSFHHDPFGKIEQLFKEMNEVTIGEVHVPKRGHDLFDICGEEKELYDKRIMSKGVLEAIFGFDDEDRLLSYDISEYGIGPHAMIGGATGSGKTSFLIAFLLSICLRYSAQEVAIALIDYKGSGIVDSLSDRKRSLRHIALSLNNIEPAVFDRSIAAFKLECERREKLFAKLSRLTGHSITHLKDYQSHWRKDLNLERLPILLIVIDEFAELKNHRPDFMKNIVSIARVGRSLGIQLILATQNPSMAIDEEIKANIGYRLALKMLNRSDSFELVGSDAASRIKKPGEFYLAFGGEIKHGFAVDIRKYTDRKEGNKVCLYDRSLKILADAVFHSDSCQHQLSYLINKINSADVESPVLAYQKELTVKSYRQLSQQYSDLIKKDDILLGEYDDYQIMEVGPLLHSITKEGSMILLAKTKDKTIDFIYLLTLSLTKRKILIIGDQSQNYPKGAEVIGNDCYDDILFVLNEIKGKNGLVLIVSDMEKIQNDNDIKYRLESLLIELNNQGIIVILCYRGLSEISNRLLNNIRAHYSLDYLDKDESIIYYGTYNSVSQEAVCFRNNRLIGFKIPVFDRSQSKSRAYAPILKHIPKHIDHENNPDRLFLGYSKLKRIKVYLAAGKTILFTSFYEEYLKLMKELYHNFSDADFINVSEVDHKKYYPYIIWCGPNIKNQFLFIVKGIEELEEGEIYLYDHGANSGVIYHVQ